LPPGAGPPVPVRVHAPAARHANQAGPRAAHRLPRAPRRLLARRLGSRWKANRVSPVREGSRGFEVRGLFVQSPASRTGLTRLFTLRSDRPAASLSREACCVVSSSTCRSYFEVRRAAEGVEVVKQTSCTCNRIEDLSSKTRCCAPVPCGVRPLGGARPRTVVCDGRCSCAGWGGTGTCTGTCTPVG
jgi:hypothetical protein